MKMSHSTKVSVPFASHTHHVPHTGFAQTAPVMMALVKKTTPTSAET